jgi:hypothetical protein
MNQIHAYSVKSVGLDAGSWRELVADVEGLGEISVSFWILKGKSLSG